MHPKTTETTNYRQKPKQKNKKKKKKQQQQQIIGFSVQDGMII
jgi:hypothetical protein